MAWEGHGVSHLKRWDKCGRCRLEDVLLYRSEPAATDRPVIRSVRNRFTFSASERDRETDEEWEHYRDSDGKSGGQKEKLA